MSPALVIGGCLAALAGGLEDAPADGPAAVAREIIARGAYQELLPGQPPPTPSAPTRRRATSTTASTTTEAPVAGPGPRGHLLRWLGLLLGVSGAIAALLIVARRRQDGKGDADSPPPRIHEEPEATALEQIDALIARGRAEEALSELFEALARALGAPPPAGQTPRESVSALKTRASVDAVQMALLTRLLEANERAAFGGRPPAMAELGPLREAAAPIIARHEGHT